MSVGTQRNTVVCYRDRNTTQRIGYELVSAKNSQEAIKEARVQYMERYLNAVPRTLLPICKLNFHVFGINGQIQVNQE